MTKKVPHNHFTMVIYDIKNEGRIEWSALLVSQQEALEIMADKADKFDAIMEEIDNYMEGKVCGSAGCLNKPSQGIIYCPECMEVGTRRADDGAINLKKMLEESGVWTLD